MSDQLAAKLLQARRDLISSVAHANEGWNGKLIAERERDDALTAASNEAEIADEARLATKAALKAGKLLQAEIDDLKQQLIEELATGE